MSSEDAGECATGLTRCDLACVDGQIDRDNCGGCGFTCSGMCTGGRCLTMLAETNWPDRIAVDATNVYWTITFVECQCGPPMKVPLGGGTPSTLALGLKIVGDIAVDATSVYWIRPGFGVMKMPLAGGAATALPSDQSGPDRIAVDNTSIYWTNHGWSGGLWKLTVK